MTKNTECDFKKSNEEKNTEWDWKKNEEELVNEH